MTSKGRFGAEEERGSGGTSTRRRLAPRSLATITVGGHESIMVQTLRLEEQQRVKEEKRLKNIKISCLFCNILQNKSTYKRLLENKLSLFSDLSGNVSLRKKKQKKCQPRR